MKPVWKWTRRVLGGLAVILVLALATVYGASEMRMRKTYEVPVSPLALHSDAVTVERGRHIAVTRGCTDCHAASLGGNMFIDAPPVAQLFASNLTTGEGGVSRRYTDADWVRAIRHGIRPDGKPLLVMPSHEFYPLSDADLGTLIAYLKSVPPVDNAPVKNSVGPLGRALFLAGQLPLLPAEMIDHDGPCPAAPAEGPTAEYGAYIAVTCTGCHEPGLSGGKIPGTPPEFPIATNITPDEATGIGNWTEQDFFRAMREGKRPDGSSIDPFMPWKNYRLMSDDELRALWLYLQTVLSKPHGAW